MAKSMIADLLKTPEQIQMEEQNALRDRGLANAQALLMGSGGSPISGAIRGLSANALMNMPQNMQSAVSRGMLGLSKLAGVAGAPGAQETLRKMSMSPEQQKAEAIQKAAGSMANSPEGMRQFADKLRQMGRSDLAMKMEDKAFELEMRQEEMQLKREALELKKKDKGERYKTVGNRIFDVQTATWLEPEGGIKDGKKDKPFDAERTVRRDGVDYKQHIKYVNGEPKVINEWEVPKDLTATMQKQLTDAQEKYVTAESQVGQMDNLIKQLKETPFEGGITKQAAEGIKAFTGDLDLRSYLDMQFKNLRSKEAMNNLPPGSASDADVRLALSGVPPENASSAYISKWLKAVKSVNKKVSEFQRFRAQYISAKGDTRGMIKEWEGQNRKIMEASEGVLQPDGTVDFNTLPQ